MGKIQLLETLVRRNPADPFALYALAIELRNEERFEEARTAFSSVKQNFPLYLPNYYHLGAELERIGDVASAEAVYREGIRLAEQQSDIHARDELARALQQIVHE